MKKAEKHMSSVTPLNEDISNLYVQFDDHLEQYHEIRFADIAQTLFEKWPLIKEIENQKTK